MVFILNDTGAASRTINLTGSDQLVYEKGSEPVTIVGGSGIDIMFGGSGVTTLVAGNNNDYLFAGSGPTTLQSNGGTDFLQAGTGPDVFDLSPSDIGTVLIAGFKLETDRLHVIGASPGSASLNQLIAATTLDMGGNAVLQLAPEHDVTLLGVGLSQVGTALFI
jgi:Ca2+-binding RTX toxin-like protein